MEYNLLGFSSTTIRSFIFSIKSCLLIRFSFWFEFKSLKYFLFLFEYIFNVWKNRDLILLVSSDSSFFIKVLIFDLNSSISFLLLNQSSEFICSWKRSTLSERLLFLVLVFFVCFLFDFEDTFSSFEGTLSVSYTHLTLPTKA